MEKERWPCSVYFEVQRFRDSSVRSSLRPLAIGAPPSFPHPRLPRRNAAFISPVAPAVWSAAFQAAGPPAFSVSVSMFVGETNT
jgi:hypothetical protein